MERVFFLDQEKYEKLYLALYHAIVDEIRQGSLSEHERLPSVRQLSKSLNVSKTTVENAYHQLVAEGYLYTKAQSGYYVMPIPLDRSLQTHKSEDKVTTKTLHLQQSVYDFQTEYVEKCNFDLGTWKRNVTQVLNEEEIKLFRQGSPFGEEELKTSICNYFSRVRGIRADQDQIIIGSGISSLLRPLGSHFKHLGYQSLQMENPGFHVAREVFSELSYRIIPIALQNKVLSVENLHEQQSIVFTSPSYQFPYGEIMPVSHRYQLLEWAKRNESYIIEDDYNNELRYVGKPIPALQGMDPYDRVIYFGSFSTILIPSIRISFMILPKRLVSFYQERNLHTVQASSKLEQLALSKYIDSGDLARHIRKIRKNYRTKNEEITTLLLKHMKGLAEVDIEKAGVTAVLHLQRQVPEPMYRSLCEQFGLKIPSMQEFMVEASIETEVPPVDGNLRQLVLNYRGIESKSMENAILLLKEVLCRLF